MPSQFLDVQGKASRLTNAGDQKRLLVKRNMSSEKA